MGANKSSQSSSKRPVKWTSASISDAPTVTTPNVLVEAEIYREFLDICRKQDRTYSAVIRRFIRETVAEAQEAA